MATEGENLERLKQLRDPKPKKTQNRKVKKKIIIKTQLKTFIVQSQAPTQINT